jgi:DNA-binding transcriptional ArsR family regulator
MYLRVMKRQDEIFRALADPTRRAVFERLFSGEATVGELTSSFSVSQPAISQHLRVLRGAGLVRERRSGRNVFYRVDPKGLRPLVDWLAHYQAFWNERLEQLNALTEAMKK